MIIVLVLFIFVLMQRHLLLLFLRYSVIKLFHHPLPAVLWYRSGRNDRAWALHPHQAFFVVFLALAILTRRVDIMLWFILLKVFLFQYWLDILAVIIYVALDNRLHSSLVRVLIKGRLEGIGPCAFLLLLEQRFWNNFWFFDQAQLPLLHLKHSCCIYLLKVLNLRPVPLWVINEYVVV